MSISEKIYRLHKGGKSAYEIGLSLNIGFKEVLHRLSNKPAKVNGKRVFK